MCSMSSLRDSANLFVLAIILTLKLIRNIKRNSSFGYQLPCILLYYSLQKVYYDTPIVLHIPSVYLLTMFII